MNGKTTELAGIGMVILTIIVMSTGGVNAVTRPASNYLIDAHNIGSTTPPICNLSYIHSSSTTSINITTGDNVTFCTDLVLHVNNSLCPTLDWTYCTVDITYKAADDNTTVEDTDQLYCAVFRSPGEDTDVTNYTWYNLTAGDILYVTYEIAIWAEDPFNLILAYYAATEYYNITTY